MTPNTSIFAHELLIWPDFVEMAQWKTSQFDYAKCECTLTLMVLQDTLFCTSCVDTF